MSHVYPVVAVGGGPAGIALAVECIALGLDPKQVPVLEKGADPIMAIRQFYPEKKMTLPNYKGLPTETHGHLKTFAALNKAETLEYFDDLIAKYELDYRLNTEVHKVEKKGDLFEITLGGGETMQARHVAIGIGILGRPNKPSYKLPAKLRTHLLFDMTSQEIKGCKVLVVGGGDSAGEYCQYLQGADNTISLSYRREKISRMMDINRDAVEKLVQEGKLDLRLGTDIQEIQEENEKPKVAFVDGKEEVFDKVLFALGGTTPVNFLKTIGVDFIDDWPAMAETGETNIEKLYLIGDLYTGKKGGSIILSYNSAYRTAMEVMKDVHFDEHQEREGS